MQRSCIVTTANPVIFLRPYFLQMYTTRKASLLSDLKLTLPSPWCCQVCCPIVCAGYGLLDHLLRAWLTAFCSWTRNLCFSHVFLCTRPFCNYLCKFFVAIIIFSVSLFKLPLTSHLYFAGFHELL